MFFIGNVMGKDEDFNIFDQARKHLGKKKKKKPAVPSPAEVSAEAPPLSNQDPMEMIRKIQKMEEDLKQKMTQVYELSGMTKNELETYIENPQNFSDADWLKAQSLKDNLEEKFYANIDILEKKKQLHKKKLKISKDRRGKTLGGRKGWLQM